MRRAYQIVSTFGRAALYTREGDVRKPANFAAGNLPRGCNFPMLARETLLAQRLRTGRGLDFAINTNGAAIRPEKSNFRPVEPKAAMNAFQMAKESPALKGKLIGVEIEYYPKTMPVASGLRQVAYDGSLGSAGKEVKVMCWASADGRIKSLVNLKLDGRVDKSCGLHVHIDVRHLNADEKMATYQRLLEFQPMLKKLVPASRKRNKFCKWMDNSHRNCRYAAINYQAIYSHGTIEFRCQGGSLNPVKIETWALLCRWLVAYAANPLNVMPRNWSQFVAILPEPFRSWCIMRKENLSGDIRVLNERTMSGIDLAFTTVSCA